MPAAAGDVGKSNNIEIISVGVKDLAAIAKGDVVTFDANGFALVGTTTENPRVTGRGVALEAKTGATDGVIKIRIAVHGDVYVTAGAAIKPNAQLQVDATAGRVATATIGATTEWNKYLDAYYIGHENEDQGATDAADNDIILVRLQ